MKNKENLKKAESIYQALSGWELTWKGLTDNSRGEWWLLAQVAILASHAVAPWPSITNINYQWPPTLTYIGGIGFVFSLILIIKALIDLGTSLSPLPEPKANASLVIHGAYKRCRHPLYQALVISSISICITLGSIIHLILFIILCLILRGKAKREEESLLKIHPDYKLYKKVTPAIIPRLPLLDWRK